MVFPTVLLWGKRQNANETNSLTESERMKRLILSTSLALSPVLAAADERLDRFEELADSMSVAMIEMMSNDIENAGGDASALRALDRFGPEWDGEMRTAAGCIIDTYVDEAGAAEVDAMLDKMEALIPQMATMSMEQATEDGTLDAMQPAGISDDRMIDINRDCGMMELQIKAAQESGLMEAMMAAGSTIPGNN